MKFKKNLTGVASGITEEDLTFEFNEGRDPHGFGPWYEQFMQLDDAKRKLIVSKALERIKISKPETFDFIQNFNCELIGISPRCEYALVDSNEGDVDVTWVHGFGLPTLLYWCPAGKFALLVNANLDYNDTVLNRVKGNSKQKLKGLTS